VRDVVYPKPTAEKSSPRLEKVLLVYANAYPGKVESQFEVAKIEKDALRAWRSRVRDILNREWDPIGGCPEDEYDGYIGKITSLLRDPTDDEALLQYLKWAEVENMGLGPASSFDRDNAMRVIASLREMGAPPDITKMMVARVLIYEAVRDMLAGRLSYIEGARKICPARFAWGLDEWDNDIRCFIGIESETDALPFGEMREFWQAAALEALQPEIEQKETWARKFAEPHCRKLAKRFMNNEIEIQPFVERSH
jgi:hypothetical protein